MCGIFGFVLWDSASLKKDLSKKLINALFKLSESRGKEAAGLAILSNNIISVYKQPLTASKMIRTKDYKNFLDSYIHCSNNNDHLETPFAFIGHSRLVTDGVQGISYNNQPVVKDEAVCVHNGIIVNVDALWNRFDQVQREYEVDTEIIPSLARLFYKQTNRLDEAIKKVFSLIEGSASIGLLFNNTPYLGLATNTGSLYLLIDNDKRFLIFASEVYILRQLTKQGFIKRLLSDFSIFQIKPNEGYLVNIYEADLMKFFVSKENHLKIKNTLLPQYKVIDLAAEETKALEYLKRCSRCILPETFPGIEFDENGVCNYCKSYKKTEVKGHKALEELADRYRSHDGSPDCIVCFSGGRDSSYMLHYVKTVLKMNPIAYTYDWGMVTDLARRNQARICGKLGIEHIIISADIKAKRKNIQRNVKAWLKKPDLGMVPLFMAGDKQYFYYADKLRKQLGIKLVLLGGNPLEKTDFKSRFCGVKEVARRPYDIPIKGKIQMALYYLKQFIKNPAYFNWSILDTLFAFYSSYLARHDFVWFYQYIRWDEKEIMATLLKEYNWETAVDTKTTWRIGDGTAAFYNYIYYTVAGFSEIDTFRSNQIREEMITREEALKMAEIENQPRYESIREYMYQIGVDYEEALYVINSMPKLYIKKEYNNKFLSTILKRNRNTLLNTVK
ncbi:MAG: hypothetical protein DRG39_03175 [Deltaproteobacteria bacterium]|nr:MAG: hypothetical protein DRG39_03175 [Deltaproteobacteria bacterium]